MRIRLIIAALALSITGCASTGHRFDASRLAPLTPGVANFADVANALAKNLGVRIVLIGSGPGKDPLKYDFLKRSRCKPIDASGKTNVPRLAALIKRCDVLLSSDSAPLHVAASVATPFVALFGPTDPARHLAPADNFTVLKKDFKCSPCYRTYCRRGLVCMKAIKPDEVYEAIRRFLK